ncbi:hypothetical protein FE257_002691 [Aspergillus nanangensis]|uniref:Aminoglycoside phosphotransferase domain-containing protein n=1 Tax=Aspergillus nanangensis TaxID=2582783 RepID=A0AAD4CCR5_ASPNN|nr:hypothetical protein FE257_002691 [Aspergillus nanangensis]
MDISKYAAEAASYDNLSVFQISRFFKQHSLITRDACDSLATDILRCPVTPTPVQGGSSYTVTAIDSSRASKVVQFRSKELDMHLMKLARQSYGGFVPNGELYSVMLGDVHVYVWDIIPGTAFCRVRREFLACDVDVRMEQRLYQTVQDFARFLAASWNNSTPMEQPLGLLHEYSDILDRISQGLPERLQVKLNEVRKELPLLFRPEYPMVFQHDDLLENNIHVDETTGHITGIVDWSDAIIAPFGISLGGLETLLGVQTMTNWHFHPSHLSLRRYFWRTLYSEIGSISKEDQRSIEVARLFGLLWAHGFEEKDRAIVYLEALCLL